MSTRIIVVFTAVFCMLVFKPAAYGVDTDLTRSTMSGIQGVSVMVEELQPNIQKYAPRFNLKKEQLQKEIEQRLQKAGIQVLTGDAWLKSPGKPVLYVNINTHEYEKYWYAFDITVNLQQIVALEANPKLKTLACTWDISMTGVANIGTLNAIRGNVETLIDRFIQAYRSANPKK
jgi:hypothetical protein